MLIKIVLHRALHWQLVYWNILEAIFKIQKHWVHAISEHFHSEFVPLTDSQIHILDALSTNIVQ